MELRSHNNCVGTESRFYQVVSRPPCPLALMFQYAEGTWNFASVEMNMNNSFSVMFEALHGVKDKNKL